MSGDAGRVRNRWTVERDTQVSWYAELPSSAEHTRWQRMALRLGAELAVYRVLAIPEIGFDGAVHGRLDAFLDANPHLDTGSLLFAHPQSSTSTLAVATAAGTVAEQDVADLGTVLEAAPFAAPVRHRRPLELRSSHDGPDAIRASVSTCSDIWLPWSSARYEPDAESEDFADNTALARRHTPRLNEWLDRLGEGALGLGGTWALDRDTTDRDLLFQLDDHGVLLDAGQPFVRAFEEPVAGLGRDGVLAALRAALAWMRSDPPQPPYGAVLRATVTAPGHELYTAGRDRMRHALREPVDPRARLTRDELREVARIEVDNRTDRHTFSVDELLA
jgi:hypothetical protein